MKKLKISGLMVRNIFLVTCTLGRMYLFSQIHNSYVEKQASINTMFFLVNESKKFGSKKSTLRISEKILKALLFLNDPVFAYNAESLQLFNCCHRHSHIVITSDF